jgi:hypothetical protein
MLNSKNIPQDEEEENKKNWQMNYNDIRFEDILLLAQGRISPETIFSKPKDDQH